METAERVIIVCGVVFISLAGLSLGILWLLELAGEDLFGINSIAVWNGEDLE